MFRNIYFIFSLCTFYFVVSMSAAIDIQDTIQQALQNHKNGKVEEAISGYELALKNVAGPVTATLHSNVASLYMMSGNIEQSRHHFEAALEANPNSAEAHFNLAVLLTTKFAEHGKAIKHCGKSLKLNPDFFKSMHLMGNILQTLGKPDDAERYFIMAEEAARKLGGAHSSNSSTTVDADRKSGKNKVTAFFESWPFTRCMKSNKLALSNSADGEGAIVLECLSDEPKIWIVKNFLSVGECEHIAASAKDKLEKSFMSGGSSVRQQQQSAAQEENGVPAEGNNSEIDSSSSASDLYRSSYNAWLSYDPVISGIQSRLAQLLQLPLGYVQQKSEELQVVNYKEAGQFKAHHDSSSFHPRFITALMYLNSIDESHVGGGTWFPFADCAEGVCPTNVDDSIRTALGMYHLSGSESDGTSSAITTCSTTINTDSLQAMQSHGITVQPEQGSIVIFLNHDPADEATADKQDSLRDPKAVHAGLPVLSLSSSPSSHNTVSTSDSGTNTGVFKDGEKWIANYWLKLDRDTLNSYL